MARPRIANTQAEDAMSLAAGNEVDRQELVSAIANNAAFCVKASNCEANRHAASR
jgi:hypothetical protein